MEFKRLTAAEAAAMIENGQTIGLSGFTPAGVAKSVPAEIAKKAESEHAAGRPYKINIFTGASTGQSCDGDMANAQAIGFRAPYTTNPDFRRHVNLNELAYSDLNLSNMATQIRQGYLGQVNWAIIEACALEKVGNKAHIYLTAAGGISPTVCRLATEGIIIELNAFHEPSCMGIHDVYEIEDHPHRTPIMITRASDRIGKPYVEVDADRIIGVVECNIPDEARSFKDPDPITTQIGQNVADFLLQNMKQGLIPPTFLNLQSGVGSGANAVLGALGHCPEVPNFSIYTEVLQDAPVQLMRDGRVLSASACSLTVTNECLKGIYRDMDFFRDKLVLRPSEISNCPEVIARIGVCSLNTAIEADIYGHINSTKICGTKMMNGIGGSADFTNSAYLSIFTCGSTTKGGAISSIVPFCSHIDHTNHFVDAVITEYGVADLRHKSDMQKAEELIRVAHPDYQPLLRDYLKYAAPFGGHTHHCLSAAFAMHDTFLRKGDMRLTDLAEYVK
ncbi:MAG: acetyl-CoA hydrolase [Bacteroidaceae bacterium]|nr:acetyl-CoA hydrolase [Bacteroidaceae bacterium]MBQ2460067.1 acetyl-CoA hydrolase [Bacteroidaceae bacterium]MBQ2519136.1 acetyl-CoA hydrolase [Bacteroidaceae bacterium]MBQ3958489.1 acetyl-CoA hydrolase [Bacteroidaceae bacterium]